MKHSIITFLLIASVLTIGGCNNLSRSGAPKDIAVFNRFDRVRLNESTSNEVLAFIQDTSMGEYISQDEQTIVSWGQDSQGAVIWLNAVSFDSEADTAARKYAMLINDASPRWDVFNEMRNRKFQVEFEYVLPPEFDEIEITSENTRRKEALKTALKLYMKDINNIRFDSDYVYTASMLLSQTFNALFYELERVPAKLATIDSLEGLAFEHPTLGDSRIRMLFDTESYIVRVKLKVGSLSKSFAKHKDVIAMGEPVAREDDVYIQSMAADERERRDWLNWISTVGEGKDPQQTARDFEQIEQMAQQRADAEVGQLPEKQSQEIEQEVPDIDSAIVEQAEQIEEISEQEQTE